MQRFIFKTVVFLLPICIVLGTAEFLARRIPNDYSLKRDYLDCHGDELSLLILGSSHSYYGVDPRFFSRPAFNAACVSQTLKWDLWILEKHIDRLANLEHVILPISYFSLTADLEQRPQKWRMKNYHLYYGYESLGLSPQQRFELLNHSAWKLARMIVHYAMDGRDNVSCSPLGFGTSYHLDGKTDLPKSGVAAAKRHTLNDPELVSNNKRHLRRIIQLCQDRGIRVLLFTPPAHASYRNELDRDQLRTVKSMCRQLASTSDTITYVDLLASQGFVDEDYRDGDHLNEQGARKLSVMLDRQILAEPALGSRDD